MVDNEDLCPDTDKEVRECQTTFESFTLDEAADEAQLVKLQGAFSKKGMPKMVKLKLTLYFP